MACFEVSWTSAAMLHIFLKGNVNIPFPTHEEAGLFLCCIKGGFGLGVVTGIFLAPLCAFEFLCKIDHNEVLCVWCPLQLIQKYLWVFRLAGKEHEKILYILSLKTDFTDILN